MSDVILNFVGNTEQLAPAANALDGLKQKDKELAEQAKATGAAYDSRNKTASDSTKKVTKDVGDLVNASKQIDKAVVGGAYKKSLQDIQKEMNLTNKQFVEYILNAKKKAQTDLVSLKQWKASADEINKVTQNIETMNELLKELGVSTVGTAEKTKTLTSRIKDIRNELARMEDAGLAGTQAYDELRQKGGDLQDQMDDLNASMRGLGSDTKNIDGFISLMSGVVGGYAVAQGAAALFGDENEEVQKALLKVNAAMSILQGLQQIQQVLQKESAASLLLQNALRKKQAATVATETAAEGANLAMTEANTAATLGQAAATETATVATKGFTSALLANPVTAILVGVLALVTAIDAFNSSSTLSAKIQDDVNDSLEEAGPLMEAYLESLDRQTKLLVANAKLSGASVNEITKIQGEAANRRINQIKDEADALRKQYNEQIATFNKLAELGIGVDKEVYEAHNKLYEKMTELDKQYANERNDLEVKGVEFRKKLRDDELKSYASSLEAAISLTIAGSDQERQVRIAAIKATQQDRIKSAKEQGATEGDVAKIIADDERQIQGLQLQNYQHYLKGRTSANEAYIADAKLQILKNEKDTIESINRITDLEISAAKKRKAEALSDPTLNAGEREKIVKEVNLQIAELEKQKQAKILDIQKSGINAQLIASKKGSKEEYDNKIALLNKEQEIELSAIELAPEKRKEIEAKYNQQRQDALKAFNELQLQNDISNLNAQVDQFGISEEKKLSMTLDRLQKQKELELSQAEGNASKIAEINTKYDNQTRDAKLANLNLLLQEQLKFVDAFSAGDKSYFNRVLQSNKATYEEKKKANAALAKLDLERLGYQLESLKESKEQNLITDKEYTVAYQEILNQQNELLNKKLITDDQLIRDHTQKQIELLKSSFDILRSGMEATLDTSAFKTGINEVMNLYTQLQEIRNSDATEEEKRNATITAGIVAAQSVINQSFADAAQQRNAQYQEELNHLQELKDKELSNKNLTEAQKVEIDKRYQTKEKQLKLKAWNDDKQAKKQQAIINGLLAIATTFAHFGWPAGIIPAAIQAGLNAGIIAKISATKPPKFKQGVIDLQGPGTNTSDSIPSFLSKGESVMTAKETRQWKDALVAMRNNEFDDYIMKKAGEFTFPRVPSFVQSNTSQFEINYDELGRAIAKNVPEPLQFSNTIDENGLHQFVRRGSNITEFKNKRYSMK